MHDMHGFTHYHDSSGKTIPGEDDEIEWTTVGVDIGSSTSQLVFSRIRLARDDAHYVVVERAILHQSEVILTPYTSPEIIDSVRLALFIDQQYQLAGITREEIDTGAVILTGLALSTSNSRAIADAVADDSGKFVAVSAGDILEAKLAASGAGVAALSLDIDDTVVHIDIGGGTTKLSAWKKGRLQGLAAMDVGARLVTFDVERRIVRIEVPAQKILKDLGLDLQVGKVADTSQIEVLVEAMANEVLIQAGILSHAAKWPMLLRTTPLLANFEHTHDHHDHGLHRHDHKLHRHHHENIEAAIFSGGVSEYIYGREKKVFGDLGLPLGLAINRLLKQTPVRLLTFEGGIRATVLGVSQHSIQLSGNTVYVSDDALLPLRNIPVLLPDLDLSPDDLNIEKLIASITASFKAFEGLANFNSLAIAIPWQGSATYQRLSVLASAIVATLHKNLAPQHPLVLILDGDIAGVLGARLEEELNGRRGIICLDAIEVNEFDHVDIGEFVPKTRALPVAIKSLLFSAK
jgi:ethanolamine utilization protein EutA